LAEDEKLRATQRRGAFRKNCHLKEKNESEISKKRI